MTMSVPEVALRNVADRLLIDIRRGRVGSAWKVMIDDKGQITAQGVTRELKDRFVKVSYWNVFDAILDIVEQDMSIGDYYLDNDVPTWMGVSLLQWLATSERPTELDEGFVGTVLGMLED